MVIRESRDMRDGKLRLKEAKYHEVVVTVWLVDRGDETN